MSLMNNEKKLTILLFLFAACQHKEAKPKSYMAASKYFTGNIPD